MVWLGAMLVLGLAPVHAATPDDGQAARALLEKALAYYHDNGDKAFAAFSRQGNSSTRIATYSWWIPRV